uniref:Uncharacterized protein n=1 Tax=Ditylenchus dipsaci TaxID=166011 RepID=A0A915CZZ9_9BILA
MQTGLESKAIDSSAQVVTKESSKAAPLTKNFSIEKSECSDAIVSSIPYSEKCDAITKSALKEEISSSFRPYFTQESSTDVTMQRLQQTPSQAADKRSVAEQANALTEVLSAHSASLKELIQQIAIQRPNISEFKAMFCAALPEQVSLQMTMLACSIAEVELDKVLEKSVPAPKSSVEKTAREAVIYFLAKHLKEAGDRSTNLLLSMQPLFSSSEGIVLKDKRGNFTVESHLNADSAEASSKLIELERKPTAGFIEAAFKETSKEAPLAKSFSIEMSECSDAMQYGTEQSTTDVSLQQIPQTQSQLSEKAAVVEQSNALRALFCAHSASFEELIQQISMQNPSVSELKAMFCAAIPEQISLQMFTLACTLAEIELNKVLEKSMPESKSLVEKTAKDTLKQFLTKHLKEAGDQSTNLLLSMQPLLALSESILFKERAGLYKMESNLNASKTESAKSETSIEIKEIDSFLQAVSKESTKLPRVAKSLSVERGECSNALIFSVQSIERCDSTAKMPNKEETSGKFLEYGARESSTDVVMQRFQRSQSQAAAEQASFYDQKGVVPQLSCNIAAVAPRVQADHTVFQRAFSVPATTAPKPEAKLSIIESLLPWTHREIKTTEISVQKSLSSPLVNPDLHSQQNVVASQLPVRRRRTPVQLNVPEKSSNTNQLSTKWASQSESSITATLSSIQPTENEARMSRKIAQAADQLHRQFSIEERRTGRHRDLDRATFVRRVKEVTRSESDVSLASRRKVEEWLRSRSAEVESLQECVELEQKEERDFVAWLLEVLCQKVL